MQQGWVTICAAPWKKRWLARGLTHDFIKMGRALKEAAVAQAAAAAALADAWRR